MAKKYLDSTGLTTLWAKIKERDTAVQTAAANDATSKDTAVKNELNGFITQNTSDISTLKGRFDTFMAGVTNADLDQLKEVIDYIESNPTASGMLDDIATIKGDYAKASEVIPNFNVNATVSGPGILYAALTTYKDNQAYNRFLMDKRYYTYVNGGGPMRMPTVVDLETLLVYKLNSSIDITSSFSINSCQDYKMIQYQEKLIPGNNVVFEDNTINIKDVIPSYQYMHPERGLMYNVISAYLDHNCENTTFFFERSLLCDIIVSPGKEGYIDGISCRDIITSDHIELSVEIDLNNIPSDEYLDSYTEHYNPFQQKLTAGTGITISLDNVISSTGDETAALTTSEINALLV